MTYRKLGAEVTVVEAADRVLPAYDAELAKPVAASLRRLGIDLRLRSRVRVAEGADAASDPGAGSVRLVVETATSETDAAKHDGAAVSAEAAAGADLL